MLNIKTYKTNLFPDLIERIWTLENTGEKIEIITPPNQYINLIFSLNAHKYKRDNIPITTPQLEGISVKSTTYTYPEGTRLIGIRFFAFGLYPFIQIQGNKLINTTVSYPFHTKAIQGITNHPAGFSPTVLIPNIYQLMKQSFNKDAYNTILPIKKFYQQFRGNDETSSIVNYCQQTGTNYTTLNRNFTKIVGLTPKKFERLIKFRKSLCKLTDSNERLTSIGLNSGYFDQAHFIREFKMFLNTTPSHYKKLISQADKESKIFNYNFRLF